ncbi:MAG: ORF6N domain-containing protein, partial [SAR324 cluster bacterium]|nr:ORF6N domain-containing protein [SAR324 cluster bacterium]
MDQDSAEPYGAETRTPKQAVRGNKKRFPEDFMFCVPHKRRDEPG